MVRRPLPLIKNVVVTDGRVSGSSPILLNLSRGGHELFFVTGVRLFGGGFFNTLVHTLNTFPIRENTNSNGTVGANRSLVHSNRVVAVFVRNNHSGANRLVHPHDKYTLITRRVRIPIIPTYVAVMNGGGRAFTGEIVRFNGPLAPRGLKLAPSDKEQRLGNTAAVVVSRVGEVERRSLVRCGGN